jgi:hypothetical protein
VSKNTVNLTKDQEKANNAFLDFLVSDENFFVIKGAAGTGKSFLIRHLLETFYAKYKSYCLLLQKEVKEFDIRITATTNKAVNVVEDFLGDLLDTRRDISVSTIYQLLGLKVVNNTSTGKTELQFGSGAAGGNGFSPDFGKTALVFVDESSFIGEDLHEITESILKDKHNSKIVYIGDQYQLAPVGQTFSAMDTLNCNKVALKEVMRNGGHILATGTQYRDTVETGKFTPIVYNGQDVVHVKGPEFQQLIEKSFLDPKWNPSKSKILAWTNERVQEYNHHIREAAGRPKMFEVGEVVVTNEFIKGHKHGHSWSVDSEVLITAINRSPETHYGVEGYMVEIDGSYVSFMPENFQKAKDLLKAIAAEARATKDKSLWRKFFGIKETWLDLRAVYASSIHKSQGSTYDTVFLDLPDIGKNWNANDVARLMYVGITRAAKKVVCRGYLPDKYCY